MRNLLVFDLVDDYHTHGIMNMKSSEPLKTLFNIVEERFQKWLNFDVSAV